MSSADGTAYPYAQDLDRVWHKRPADDQWTNYDRRSHAADQPQFRSMCGKALPSVHVAQTPPAPDDLLDGETLCLCIGAEVTA
jgi:hypothetical protein